MRLMTGEEVRDEILRRAGKMDHPLSDDPDVLFDELDDLFYPVIEDDHVFINLATGLWDERFRMPRSRVFDLVNKNSVGKCVLMLGECGQGRVPGNNDSENPGDGVVAACYISGMAWK